MSRGIKSTALLTAGRQMITDQQGNRVQSACSGTYYPAHMKNGLFIPARWRGSFFLNDGNTKTGDNGTTIQITVWNGHSSVPGQGPADRFAKGVSVGQLMVADLRYDPWKRPFINPQTNQPMTRADGSTVMVEVPAWTYIPGSRTFLHDAVKEIASQIERGRQYTANGQQIPALDFWARPDNTTQQGMQLWQSVLAEREKLVWQQGMQYYGFSIVSVPQGVELMLQPPAGYDHRAATAARRGGNTGGYAPAPQYNQQAQGQGGFQPGPGQQPQSGTGSYTPTPQNQGQPQHNQQPAGSGFVPPMPGGGAGYPQNQGGIPSL